MNIFVMMNKQALILIALLIGLFSIPKMSTACASVSAQSMKTMPCCKDGNKHVSTKEQSPHLNGSQSINSQSHMGSDQHQSPSQGCHCLSLVNSLFIVEHLTFNLPEYSQAKYRILYAKPSLPVGFYSIWLPPKI